MKRVVIVGAGFAGLSAAKELKHSDAEAFVVDRANYKLFQPLLYQVATNRAFLQLQSRVRSVDF